ncbi:phage tail assembly protein [Psychrobacter lutiphocae]|uniref:phage tail assembly protein n=1 Tax=Psychrobacter lutiphocae TaxID=540500 RepID=UPI00037F3D41|nr:phage tail assembly protein [Psychrobacter lutiphocae]
MSKDTKKEAVANQPIKLQHPFATDAGVPVEQVTVKGITVRQMKQAQRRGGSDEAEVETAMVAVACDLVVEDLENMQMVDYVAVRERFQQLNFNRTE